MFKVLVLIYNGFYSKCFGYPPWKESRDWRCCGCKSRGYKASATTYYECLRLSITNFATLFSGLFWGIPGKNAGTSTVPMRNLTPRSTSVFHTMWCRNARIWIVIMIHLFSVHIVVCFCALIILLLITINISYYKYEIDF